MTPKISLWHPKWASVFLYTEHLSLCKKKCIFALLFTMLTRLDTPHTYLQTNKWSHNYVIRLVCLGIKILILKFLFTACYSCRAFFRRGVGASDQYQCTYGQKCKITLKSRKQCQYCRFQKCLEIGMKPTWVMTDEEKKEKREKTIKRKQLPPALPKIKLQVNIVYLVGSKECYLPSGSVLASLNLWK